MKKLIGIIDDSKLAIYVAKNILKSELKSTIKIACFNSPSNFLECGLEKIKNFDLILIDYFMNGMNGGELVKSMRNYKINVPVIFLTANNDSTLSDDLIKLGYNSCPIITKPYNSQTLIDAVKKIIK